MAIITLQVGQCGNQLGYSLFEALAREAGDDDAARSVFFREAAQDDGDRSCGGSGDDCSFNDTAPFSDATGTTTATTTTTSSSRRSKKRSTKKRWSARAVMVDMEPKAVDAAYARAMSGASGGDWSYAGAGRLARQSGSGNNWALGHNGFGPEVRDEALDLARREAERCDWLGGVLLLQSVAGGTGSGLGTYLAEALADELCAGGGAGAPLACACVWPYEAGEVAAQPYNSLLTLAGVTAAADAVLLLQNDALHGACARALGLARPSFGDLNGVAARALSGALLPARERSAERSGDGVPASASASGGMMLRPLADICERVTCHPRYRVASLRHAPLLAPGTADFTALSWPALLRRLRQSAVTGSFLDDGVSWATTAPAPASAAAAAAAAAAATGGGANGIGHSSSSSSDAVRARGGLPAHRYRNAAAASALFLRGPGAPAADAGEFADPHFHAPWSASPLLVGASASRPRDAPLSATLVAADQSAVAPARRMLAAGQRMAAARAFAHQYEAHGLEEAALLASFAAVEDVVAAYDAL